MTQPGPNVVIACQGGRHLRHVRRGDLRAARAGTDPDPDSGPGTAVARFDGRVLTGLRLGR